MKQVVILSGKGGTGKTTVAAALAHLISREQTLVLADADVDAPNLGIILQPQPAEVHPFSGGMLARIDPSRCTACSRCDEVCRFSAVHRRDGHYAVDPLACEGCGACATQCPAEAIVMQERASGHWQRSQTRFGTLVHARLEPGEANSGKLVSRVRAEALATAADQHAQRVLIDGAPGTGCPVIAAVAGVDLALFVAEPTASGWHDLERAMAVAAHFGTAGAVCINKSDINPTLTDRIAARCREQGLPVVAQLPFDEMAVRAMRALQAVTEMPPSPLADGIREMHSAIDELISGPRQEGVKA